MPGNDTGDGGVSQLVIAEFDRWLDNSAARDLIDSFGAGARQRVRQAMLAAWVAGRVYLWGLLSQLAQREVIALRPNPFNESSLISRPGGARRER